MSSDSSTHRDHDTKMTNSDTIKLELSIEDINLILESLGALPFARVYSTIGRIQEQARGQLSPGEQDQPG
jgi:hypothetical protein